MPEPPAQALLKRDEIVVPRMKTPRPAVKPEPGFSQGDVLFALFKHKKKIILGAIAGLVTAAAVYFFYPPVYESQAKLLVRYVVERTSVDSMDNPGSGGLTRSPDSVLGSEAEILTSWDLAVQVAEAVGVKRLFPDATGTPTKEAAAGRIAAGLTVNPSKGNNILFVSYRNRDPELATLVLTELVNRYFNKHLEVHRSAGAFDFVTQQTDQVRTRLDQTEDALNEIKEKAGIVSLDDATKNLSGELTKTEEQLYMTEAELAEQKALVRQLRGPSVEVNSEALSSPAAASASPPEEIPNNVIEQYQTIVSRLPQLRQAKMELLAKYRPENQMVKAKQAEIDEAEIQRRVLERQYPPLPTIVRPIASSRNQQQLDPGSEEARLAGLQARKNLLVGRLGDLKDQVKKLLQLGPQIADLERQKGMQEANYKYFQGTLEKARVDEALDPSKMPNISAVQRPSPPMLVTARRNKLAMAAALGGLATAVGFALLKELFLTRTIRRSSEIEKFVGISPLMSIPYRSNRNSVSGPRTNGHVDAIIPKATDRTNLAPWGADHFIRPYAQAIRDRLGLYFELHHLTHKPKLVGVAAFSEDAGTSTLAAGLAAALSETNDGKVLLVDVSLGPDHVHPFFKGKPAYALNAALRPNGAIDAVVDNLYLATVGSSQAGPAQLGLKKFFDLMPNLKASDFDYIIFDMPSLYQTSPTWGMAAFMDKLLLVVEAEKNTRDVVTRGYRRLVTERDNVSVVFNKAGSYGPKSLELES